MDRRDDEGHAGGAFGDRLAAQVEGLPQRWQGRGNSPCHGAGSCGLPQGRHFPSDIFGLPGRRPHLGGDGQGGWKGPGA
eukprot:1447450-Pyramimonas_sp.AAC.1